MLVEVAGKRAAMVRIDRRSVNAEKLCRRLILAEIIPVGEP